MELQQTVIWTIGHSTHSMEAFLEMLRSFGIGALADVRRFPASGKYPHFNQQRMEQWLAAASIEYVWLPELGGRRKPLRDSHNTIWRNASFRGYADYMETEPFRDGIERLLQVAHQRPTALMCAEAVWWRCHRALIADYLKARGIDVIHILSSAKSSPHPYTSAARIVDGKLTYLESANAL